MRKIGEAYETQKYPAPTEGIITLKTDTLSVTFAFDNPFSNARNERNSKSLGAGQKFQLQWKQNEAYVISFEP